METKFNKYLFLSDLETELLTAVEDGQIEDIDALEDWMIQSIDNACIYYSDCFDIVKELGFTDWSNCDYEVSGITSAAYAALTEYVHSNIDLTEVHQAIDAIGQE
jgi:hypothetical protein